MFKRSIFVQLHLFQCFVEQNTMSTWMSWEPFTQYVGTTEEIYQSCTTEQSIIMAYSHRTWMGPGPGPILCGSFHTKGEWDQEQGQKTLYGPGSVPGKVQNGLVSHWSHSWFLSLSQSLAVWKLPHNIQWANCAVLSLSRSCSSSVWISHNGSFENTPGGVSLLTDCLFLLACSFQKCTNIGKTVWNIMLMFEISNNIYLHVYLSICDITHIFCVDF